MGAWTSIDSAALKRVFYIFVAGSAFCLSAFIALSPVSGNPEESRPFSLRCQYSSFADDSVLYTGAYRNAEGLMGGESEGEGTGGSAGGEDGPAGVIVAGTISHHLFARDLIARYFTELARRVHPRTIIVIGPNHRARGHFPIALSALRWRTPFGFVEPDSETIRRISHSGLACVEEDAFVNEHSIGALVPFIRRSFPRSRIVPVIFKKIADRQNCVNLAGILSSLMDSALVLASLDFSHYKISREARKEDIASLSVLRSLSTERIDEAFVDSRPALLTLMQLCKNLRATNVEVVQHTNSGIMSRNSEVACTSYINTYIVK
jgi:AmmeMemoRadiSam system protein B